MILGGLWLGTIVISYIMKSSHNIKVLKDVFDNSYKFDIKNLSKVEKELNVNAPKMNFLSMFIPIYNIIKVSKRIKQYNIDRNIILSQLDGFKCLDKMNSYEELKYLKKESLLSAINISLNSKKELKKEKSIKVYDGLGYSEIFYKTNKNNDDIAFLKATGKIAESTIIKQNNIVSMDLKNNNCKTLSRIKNEKRELFNLKNMLLEIKKEKRNINKSKIYKKENN